MADSTSIPIIVQGNSFSLAIPLQIYYINGDQMDLEDYTPDPTDEVSIQLKGSRRNYTYTPTIDGNVANIDLTGNELADNYGVVVSIVKANGQRLRSFRTDQFFIVESSDDLTTDDIIQGLEENVIYLNSSIFVAGEDGRGIESIVKTSTSGLVDTYTITYTDATTSTFNVTNGAQGAQGADGVGITSIDKTSTSGLVDTYTITMSNGTTSTFEVTNGMDGVDLGLANIVNDLTTGGATNVLSAEQGKVLKGITDHCYTNVDGGGGTYTEDEHFTFDIGKIRLQTNSFNESTQPKRATIKILTNADMADVISMTIPVGYMGGIVQATALSTSAQTIDTGWLGANTINLIGVLNNDYPYKILNFKKSPETAMNADDKTNLESGFYITHERTSPSNSAISIIDETGAVEKNIYNADDIANVKVYTKNAVDAMVLPKATGDVYQGNRIKLDANRFSHELIFSLSNISPFQFRQGAAVYGKYFFQCYDTNPAIQIYDLTNGTLVQTLTLTSNPNCHANNAVFGNFYDADNDFPLLYVSSEGERCVYVYRLVGSVGTLTISLIQTITLPSAGDVGYYPNVTVDGDNDLLVIIGYSLNSWQSSANGNKTKITHFSLPATNSDVTLSAVDAKASYEIPWTYAHQGACMMGGKIYQTWGNTSTAFGGGLLVVNQGKIESSVDFAVLGSYEPEGIGIYNGAIYVSTQNGKVFKLQF